MPRNPSPKQRQASKINGSKSRGPTSAEGRQKSARRGTKAGLRSKSVALPHEPPERGDRCDQWHGHYGPGSPASIHMTNQCARFTLLSDRVDDYVAAELAHQVRTQKDKWRRKQRQRVRFLASQIRKDTWATVEKLKSFGMGVYWIIESLEHAIVELQERGYFEPEGLEGVLMLLGMTPDDATICRSELACTINLNNLGCLPEQPAPDLAKWLEPINRPLALRNKPREELMGADAEACRANLVNTLQEALIPLRELRAEVIKAVDEPSLLEALQRASILEEPAARRAGRAQAEIRVGFHKSWRDLVKDLESGGPPRPDPDREDEDEGNDQDDNEGQEQDGEAGVPADMPAETVIHEEPAAVSTGAQTVVERACAQAAEFLPFQPEKIVEQSAQPSESVAISVEFLAARVQGAKSDLSGREGGQNGVENGRSGRDRESTAPMGQRAGGAPALTRPSADLSRGERCDALHSDPPWEKLTPRARSELEALDRDTVAEIEGRAEPMRSEERLRE